MALEQVLHIESYRPSALVGICVLRFLVSRANPCALPFCLLSFRCSDYDSSFSRRETAGVQLSSLLSDCSMHFNAISHLCQHVELRTACVPQAIAAAARLSAAAASSWHEESSSSRVAVLHASNLPISLCNVGCSIVCPSFRCGTYIRYTPLENLDWWRFCCKSLVQPGGSELVDQLQGLNGHASK